MKRTEQNAFSEMMELLSISATELARASGVDRTLITRWRNGQRRIGPGSRKLMPVVRALLALDSEGLLDAYLAPWRRQGESNEAALANYITGAARQALPVAAGPAPTPPVSGAYTKQVQVFLGHKGFQRAALSMLDTVQQLPLQREVRVLCQGRYEWLVGDMVFVVQFIAGLRRALKRGTRLLVINRKGYSVAETAAFAGPWLLAHLHGHIRSRYYDGALPEDVRFVASTHGYWSGRAEELEGVEDGLYVQTQTDAYDIRKDERIIERYLAESYPASQYRFLQAPQGEEENVRLWREGSLPLWKGGEAPDGSLYAMCRVPGFGLMTQAEADGVRGADAWPPLPSYLFPKAGIPAPGEHRIILCREDMRDGFVKARFMHEPLSTLLGRRAFVTREALAAQTRRLLAAMAGRQDFKVALMPRVAFEKLQMELVCWRNSVSVGWLQNMENSVFANDQATSGSFYGYLGFVWDRMLAGWKRQDQVARQLRKWLAGKDLQAGGGDSAKVRGWDAMP